MAQNNRSRECWSIKYSTVIQFGFDKTKMKLKQLWVIREYIALSRLGLMQSDSVWFVLCVFLTKKKFLFTMKLIQKDKPSYLVPT